MKERINTFVIVFAVTFISVAVSYFMATSNILVGPLVILGVFGFFIFMGIIYDFSFGVYILFLLGTFMFYVSRLIPAPIPFGIFYDALVVITFAGIFLNVKQTKEWTNFNNVFTFFFVIITAYQLLQLFNPNAVSISGWLVSMRNNTSLLLYITFFQLFISLKNIRYFTILWLGVAVIVALYGIYQEVFGLTAFEWRWIFEAPGRFELFYVWGSMRKFSFLSDPAAYGMFLSFSGLAFVALAFGPYKGHWKFVFILTSLVVFVAMLYSGTRTATAMVAVGLLLLILMNINSTKVILFAMAIVFAGGIIFFGPFYSAEIIRLRSTFTPSEDASMGVRDYKRLRFQNYIRTHPIGGGLMTTGTSGLQYSPGHPLAEGWDPDSGYLATALELGWIGLIIFIAFFAVVMIKGIINHFSIADPFLKNMNLVYTMPFFALSVGHFTQHAMFSRPANLIVIATYALLIRLPQFDRLNSDTIKKV
ncbi:MAG: O-antigen ligase family protein [Cyclobacteriaceae bacterium]|nr:O-antigen ligase family protein [Cyclobacteriaceae bacterium]UYN85831.1 MAG: O-antigen ligase family protein [Cyclobacteriaceae bacterium]